VSPPLGEPPYLVEKFTDYKQEPTSKTHTHTFCKKVRITSVVHIKLNTTIYQLVKSTKIKNTPFIKCLLPISLTKYPPPFGYMPFGFYYTLSYPIYTFISARPQLYSGLSCRPSLLPPHTVPHFDGSSTMEATPSPLCGLLLVGGYFRSWYSLLPSQPALISYLNHYLLIIVSNRIIINISSIIPNFAIPSSDLLFTLILLPVSIRLPLFVHIVFFFFIHCLFYSLFNFTYYAILVTMYSV
jgi:hypothetical protein